jgi:hypothetical protein
MESAEPAEPEVLSYDEADRPAERQYDGYSQ